MKLPWLDGIKRQIEQGLTAGKFGHAPLIHGPGGVGKSVLADWLVARLLCTGEPGETPCRVCQSCKLLTTGAHPDHFVLGIDEDNPAILVDQVRDFSASLALTPAISRRRAGLIVPAEAMNLNAANALLKTLEEPAEDTWLVLVSDQPDHLAATIRSRCQRIPVAPPSRTVSGTWLAERFPDSDPEQWKIAVELAGGAPLLAASWLEHSGLDHGMKILGTLIAVVEGREDGTDRIAEWHKAPEATWAWLGRWNAALMEWHLTGSVRALNGRTPSAALNPGAERQLFECWEGVLEGLRLARKPVRHDLLLRRWLLQWSQLAITRQTASG